MIQITKTDNKVDQSPEEIIELMRTNTDPMTKEFVDDVFWFVIIPKYMERFGYVLGEDNIYRK